MANNMATIEFTINMNCCTRHDDDAEVFVSHCPRLGVYSQGDSEEEALEAIKDAVTMHLTTAFDFNRLDKVLRRAGFEKFGTSEAEPLSTDHEFVQVEVKDSKQHQITVPMRMSLAQHPLQYASAG